MSPFFKGIIKSLYRYSYKELPLNKLILRLLLFLLYFLFISLYPYLVFYHYFIIFFLLYFLPFIPFFLFCFIIVCLSPKPGNVMATRSLLQFLTKIFDGSRYKKYSLPSFLRYIIKSGYKTSIALILTNILLMDLLREFLGFSLYK